MTTHRINGMVLGNDHAMEGNVMYTIIVAILLAILPTAAYALDVRGTVVQRAGTTEANLVVSSNGLPNVSACVGDNDELMYAGLPTDNMAALGQNHPSGLITYRGVAPAFLTVGQERVKVEAYDGRLTDLDPKYGGVWYFRCSWREDVGYCWR